MPISWPSPSSVQENADEIFFEVFGGSMVSGLLRFHHSCLHARVVFERMRVTNGSSSYKVWSLVGPITVRHIRKTCAWGGHLSFDVGPWRSFVVFEQTPLFAK
ncbi:hypothetical protein MUK42_04232 [Musa troglodytarum]|uniref:Uncharacterized protein n=1 Tax=Musa troglodytarum TaxID=320322 RepID=A0A9E7GF11_9LILI|nr:hypothetical protein MUK42_04232 [Musa troglodytarum]